MQLLSCIAESNFYELFDVTNMWTLIDRVKKILRRSEQTDDGREVAQRLQMLWQKLLPEHLRLQEARRLMLAEDMDAASAGFRVGYEDPSYFSREYKKLFGAIRRISSGEAAFAFLFLPLVAGDPR